MAVKGKPAAKRAEKKKSRIPKTTGISAARRAKTKRKTNLYKLCSEMNKLCIDAVDKEVVKRFKTLIDTSADEITKTSLHAVLSNPREVDFSSFHESILPYVKHYVFMIKRAKK